MERKILNAIAMQVSPVSFVRSTAMTVGVLAAVGKVVALTRSTLILANVRTAMEAKIVKVTLYMEFHCPLV